MLPPLIFLDIDGVLNTHEVIEASGVHGIYSPAVMRLNQIIERSGAQLVISSAWRYMILNGAMTIGGFRYMLMTHGLSSSARIHGHCVSDEEISERGAQIGAYLGAHGWRPYVVLDDGSNEPQGILHTLNESLTAHHGHRWIKTDPDLGLGDADVAMAINLLRVDFVD